MQKENSQDICIGVTNTVKESVAGFGITCYIGDEAFQSMGMDAADGKELGMCTEEFVLNREDIPQDADLNEFRVSFRVKETGCVEFDICTLSFPVEFGKKYEFELRNEGGCEKTMWSIVYCPEGRCADFYFAENYEQGYGLLLMEKGSFLKRQQRDV